MNRYNITFLLIILTKISICSDNQPFTNLKLEFIKKTGEAVLKKVDNVTFKFSNTNNTDHLNVILAGNPIIKMGEALVFDTLFEKPQCMIIDFSQKSYTYFRIYDDNSDLKEKNQQFYIYDPSSNTFYQQNVNSFTQNWVTNISETLSENKKKRRNILLEKEESSLYLDISTAKNDIGIVNNDIVLSLKKLLTEQLNIIEPKPKMFFMEYQDKTYVLENAIFNEDNKNKMKPIDPKIIIFTKEDKGNDLNKEKFENFGYESFHVINFSSNSDVRLISKNNSNQYTLRTSQNKKSSMHNVRKKLISLKEKSDSVNPFDHESHKDVKSEIIKDQDEINKKRVNVDSSKTNKFYSVRVNFHN